MVSNIKNFLIIKVKLDILRNVAMLFAIAVITIGLGTHFISTSFANMAFLLAGAVGVFTLCVLLFTDIGEKILGIILIIFSASVPFFTEFSLEIVTMFIIMLIGAYMAFYSSKYID